MGIDIEITIEVETEIEVEIEVKIEVLIEVEIAVEIEVEIEVKFEFELETYKDIKKQFDRFMIEMKRFNIYGGGFYEKRMELKRLLNEINMITNENN